MDKLSGMEQTVNEIRDALKKKAAGHAGSNINTVRIEGAGSIWNGLALGVVFGATIVACAWMVSSQQDMRESVRQAESYRSAVYMLAPRFAEAIDQELDQRKSRYEQHPDPDAAAQEAQAGGNGHGAKAAGP